MDDNLPLRKVALTCLESILDLAPLALAPLALEDANPTSAGEERTVAGHPDLPPLLLDPASLLSVMPLLLADKDEIKLQAHQVG